MSLILRMMQLKEKKKEFGNQSKGNGCNSINNLSSLELNLQHNI